MNQTHTNWELIIVDDFSTDDTVYFIESLIKELKIENVTKLIKNNSNKGYGHSLRKAIEASTGELIAIIDSDDALADINAFKMCADIHKKNPQVALTYSNYWECDPKLNKVKLYETRQIPSTKSYLITRGEIRVSHLKVLKKSFYDKTEGVNKELRKTVDKDLILKLEEVGTLLHIPKDLYLYRCHSKSITNTFRSHTSIRDIKKMREKIFEDAKNRRVKNKVKK
jgi:glycosyltransferase involved in cell wall biosynthesis